MFVRVFIFIVVRSTYLAGILLAKEHIVVRCQVSVLAGEVHFLPAEVAHEMLYGPAALLLLWSLRNLNAWKRFNCSFFKFSEIFQGESNKFQDN